MPSPVVAELLTRFTALLSQDDPERTHAEFVRLVSETLGGCERILAGECDEVPEQALTMGGTLDALLEAHRRKGEGKEGSR